MNRIPMLENISAHPASHRALLTLQRGNHATLRACAELIRKAPGRVNFPPAWAGRCCNVSGGKPMTSGGTSGAGDGKRRVVALRQRLSESLGRGCRDLALRRVDEAGSAGGKKCVSRMTVIAVTNVPGSTLEKIADVIGYRFPLRQADRGADLHRHSACLAVGWRKRFCLGRVRDSATRVALRCRLFPHLSTSACGASDDWQEWLMDPRSTCLGRDRARLCI